MQVSLLKVKIMATELPKKAKSISEKLVDIVQSIIGGGDSESQANDMTENIFQRRTAALAAAENAATSSNSTESSNEAYQRRLKGKK